MVVRASPGTDPGLSSPGEGTTLLDRRGNGIIRRSAIWVAVVVAALLAVAACLAVERSPHTVVLADSVRDIARIEAANRRLEQEEDHLLNIFLTQKKIRSAKHQAKVALEVSNEEKEKASKLKSENEKLANKNALLQNKLAKQKSITERIEKDLFGSVIPIPKDKSASKESEPVHPLAKARARVAASKTKMRVPRESGNSKLYAADDRVRRHMQLLADADNATASANVSYHHRNHTRHHWRHYRHKWHHWHHHWHRWHHHGRSKYDLPQYEMVPKGAMLGDNYVGFGQDDAFVEVPNSAMSYQGYLPPWKLEPDPNFNNYNNSMKPFIGLQTFRPEFNESAMYYMHHLNRRKCPADPEGISDSKLCISGGESIDGFYERPPLAPSYFDPDKVRLERVGVNVDSWAGLSPWQQHHAWGADAKDHYEEPYVPRFDYDHAERPYWAWDNHALRTDPEYENPEGPANKQLMLGQYWNMSGDALGMNDEWLDNNSYALQLEPFHERSTEKDHFATWAHSSPENLNLVYGESSVFNGLHVVQNNEGKDFEPDPWSLGDVDLNVTQYAELVGINKNAVRVGDPVRDLQAGWPLQNGVAAAGYNVQRSQYVKYQPYVEASPGRVRLEEQGVNV